jgi:hypothetical protein
MLRLSTCGTRVIMVTIEPKNKRSIKDGENKPITDSDRKNFLDFDFIND